MATLPLPAGISPEIDRGDERQIFSKPHLRLLPDLPGEVPPKDYQSATVSETMNDFFSIRGVAEKVTAMRKAVDQRIGNVPEVEFLLPELQKPTVVGNSIPNMLDI